jgi:hypothetical protein
MHDAIHISISFIYHKLEGYCAFGGSVDELHVFHHMFVVAVEGSVGGDEEVPGERLGDIAFVCLEWG